MRILLLIFGIVFSTSLTAQNDKLHSKKQIDAQEDKVPSKSQMQAQMKEAISDAKRQRDDLKKQIADAKANNEDPESIKQLEDQLVPLEQMVSVLEKTSLSDKTKTDETPVNRTIEPKFISPVIPITLKQPVKTPTDKEATDYLLWYQGKKIDNNTLITVDGTIIRYNRSQNTVIVDPDERKDSTPYMGLVRLLSQMGRMKNKFVSMMDGITNSFLMAPEIVNAYNECGYIEQRYYEIAKNHFTVPFEGLDEPLRLYWNELLDAIDNLKPLDIQMPPERRLCSCKSDPLKEYNEAMDRWQQELFWYEEDRLLEKYERIHLFFERHPDSRSLLNTTMNLKADLNRALALVIERKATKLKRLADVYNNGNIYVEDALVYAAITLNEELIEKIGATQNSDCFRLKQMSYTLIDQIKDMVVKKKIFEKFIDEQKRLENYNVVFDYSFYMNHEMNKQFLNAISGDPYIVPFNIRQIWMEGLKKFNRFKLKMVLDFELHDGKEDDLAMKADGKLESNEMIVSIGSLYPCKRQLYITQTDYRNKAGGEEKYYVPFTVKGGSKTYPKIPKGPFQYNGPVTLKMAFPDFIFSFCNNTGNDSAVMQILRYSDRDLQAYANPDYANSYSTDMLAYANKMFIGMMKTKMDATDFTRLADKMLNVDKVATPLAPTGNALLDRMVRDFFINQNRLDLQTKLPDVSHTGNTVILFDAVNGSSNLISLSHPHDTKDEADADRNIQIRLVRGIITITVVHAPL